jgi:glycosyltransferase involved in cell wall biosynthesis
MNFVSVALCTHNGARFIEEQLSSILSQSLLPQEIILSDDASSDDTVARARSVLDRHSASDPDRSVEFRVLENRTPLGVAANFEQAILACSGDLIALCDQDDRWAINRLSTAVAHFAARPHLLLLHSDARLIDDAGSPLPLSLFEALEISDSTISAIRAGRAFGEFMRRNLVTGATTMIRRRLADESVPFPTDWVHDEWLAIMATVLGEVDVTGELLIDYRQHGANQIGVRKLSITGKVRRLVEPGRERNLRLLGRARSLVERLKLLGSLVPPTFREAALQKLRHEEMRSSLSRHRLLRIVPVMRELMSGRYSRFGYGAADAARDLIQPLGGAG